MVRALFGLNGRAQGVRLWLQVLTGRGLGDGDKTQALVVSAWKERRGRFERRIGLSAGAV